MTTLVAGSRQCCLENEALLAHSYNLIAISRRVLNPAWGVTGASDDTRHYLAPDDPGSLRATIRQRLRRGTLFHAPHRIWAGRATGRSCVVCKTHISQRDLANEIVIGPVTMWAHIGCYWIWHEESCLFYDDRTQPSGSPSSPWEERP